MKIKYFLVFTALFLANKMYSQTTAELQTTAKTFMRQADYANAIIVLNRAVQKDPKNTSLQKDLALSYFYTQNNEKALELIKPVLDSKDADDQCFLIAANIYKQLAKLKECVKVYKKGIRAFPESGILYNGLGEIQSAMNNADAITNWEKGIKLDPSYSKNYYNAAHYYQINKKLVWSILYAEIFVNMDPKSPITPETKQLLLDNYKSLFTETNLEIFNKDKNKFVQKYLSTMSNQATQAMLGISAETLSMIRARFIISWFADSTSPSYKLFDYQKQLLKEGLFEAYNQWLFAPIENVQSYESWIKLNAEEHKQYMKYQSATIFKMPIEQYYR